MQELDNLKVIYIRYLKELIAKINKTDIEARNYTAINYWLQEAQETIAKIKALDSLEKDINKNY